MKPTQPATNRIFSVSEANATLPLVKAIVKDIVELSTRIIRTRQRIAYLDSIYPDSDEQVPGFNQYREETQAIAKSLAEDENRLAGCVRELYELGIEVHELTRGQVDFPAERNGQKVFLSWRYGEPKIDHWRIPDSPSSTSADDANQEKDPASDRIPLDFFYSDDASGNWN